MSRERVEEFSEMLTVADAADLTGRHKATIRRWIRSGDLEATRIKGRSGFEYRFTEEALLDALKVEGA